MGQQQLLLVILVTIIVGIATVVAINTFGDAAESANLDALRNDVAAIASSAQGFYIRPEMLGGGGNNFTNITFENITFPGTIAQNSNLLATNLNGAFEIQAGAQANSFVIRAYPPSGVTRTENTAGDPPVTTTTVAVSGPYLEATIRPNAIDWTNNANLNN